MKLILSLVLLLLPAFGFAAEKPVLAVDVIRHGDRMPISDLPGSTYQWPYLPGQLTPKGMRQEYELGVKMREDYVNRYQLLPASYTAGTLFVRSSDIDRTLMSAQSALMGLYPHGSGPALDGKPALPDAAQPIPVHTVAVHEETLLYPDGPLYKFDELRIKYAASTPEWQKKNAEASPNYERWGAATGFTLKELYDVKPLADILFIRQLYNVPPPAGLSAADVQTIIEAGQWAFAAAFRPVEIGRGTGLALLEQVANYMRDAAAGKTGLKYVLYSAHDSTILAEMSALGAPLAKAPPYSSRLNFVLADAGDGKFIVKVACNGEPVAVKGCAPDFCTLDQFAALAK